MAGSVWFRSGSRCGTSRCSSPTASRGGIVGALLGAVIGALITGAAAQIASGKTIGDTDIVTVLVAVPGALIGLASIYVIGSRADALAGIER